MRSTRSGLARLFLTAFVALLVTLPAVTRLSAEPTKLNPGTEDGILVLESDDGAYRWWFDFRVEMDVAHYHGADNDLSSGTEMRNGRLIVKTRLHRDWLAKLDVGVKGDDVKVEDAWVAYQLDPTSLVTIGNQKEPFSFEAMTSALHTTFMERALPYAFVPWRSIGLTVARYEPRWSVAGGVFGQNVDDHDAGDDEGFGITGRATLVPVSGTDRLLHLGLAVTHRTPEANDSGSDVVSFSSQPESRVTSATYLNTGDLDNTEYTRALDVEVAAVHGPACVYGEYLRTTVARNAPTADAGFEGGYIAATYFLTGESRPYRRSTAGLGRAVPKSPRGAVELAVRYSWLDLNDPRAAVFGGKENNLTFALNWYANHNVRVLTNVILVNNDRSANG
ncbi:MAG: OprO/OprP family phosphate-selective porin, partial [candidate division Zixibacteria bacterium]|nr:OprO/OprP family phosphate-selective porin [candidate division Zixibacteria bacterium]